MAEERAKDVLTRLEPRRTLGDRILARVGRRAWERPRVAVSPRIFQLYRLKDPFDPESPTDDGAVGLGPVSLRLGENKRQPAPHATPKEEKKAGLPKVQAASSGAAGAPAAKPPTPPQKPPSSSPNPASNPAPPRPSEPVGAGTPFAYIPKQYSAKPGAPPPKPAGAAPTQTTTTGLFGPKAERPSLVGKLPVRPDLASPGGGGGARATASAASASSDPAAFSRRPPMPAGPPRGTLTRSGRLTLGSATVVQTTTEPEIIELVAEAPRPAPPPPPAPLPAPPVVATPVIAQATPVIAQAPPPVVGPTAPEAPAPAPRPAPAPSLFDDELGPPPPRPAPKPAPRPPMPRSGDGLDELFAASAHEGRMRIGRAKAVTSVASADEGDKKPARAPVALPKAVLPADLPKPKPDPAD